MKCFGMNNWALTILALDGNKNPCRVVSSNVGHLLYSVLLHPERAVRAAKILMSDDMFNGWGSSPAIVKGGQVSTRCRITTDRYGHDTAIAAYGMARYGIMEPAVRLMQGLFDALLFIE